MKTKRVSTNIIINFEVELWKVFFTLLVRRRANWLKEKQKFLGRETILRRYKYLYIIRYIYNVFILYNRMREDRGILTNFQRCIFNVLTFVFFFSLFILTRVSFRSILASLQLPPSRISPPSASSLSK